MDGAGAVISALGPSLRRGSTGTPITDGTQNIVSAMDTAGVWRYVGLATSSVADPRDRPTLKAKALPIVARVAFPNALTELIGMTRTVTVLLGISMGIQNATVRKLAVPDLTTTVLTLTITGVAHHSTLEWPSWAIGTWSAVAERAPALVDRPTAGALVLPLAGQIDTGRTARGGPVETGAPPPVRRRLTPMVGRRWRR